MSSERANEADRRLYELEYAGRRTGEFKLEGLPVEYAVGIRAPWATPELLGSVAAWVAEHLEEAMRDGLARRLAACDPAEEEG